MKTKKLIELLQAEDPSGELEACVGNVDIYYVEKLPAYYDGSLQVLERDEKSKFYNIKGGKYIREGSKVNIRTLSLTDAISNNPTTCVIDYSQLSPEQAESTKKSHDELREWHRKLDLESEKEYFTDWVRSEAEKVTADTDGIEGVVYRFWEATISPDDPYPEGGIPVGYSYVTMRHMQWSQKFEVVIDDGFLKIRHKSAK